MSTRDQEEISRVLWLIKPIISLAKKPKYQKVKRELCITISFNGPSIEVMKSVAASDMMKSSPLFACFFIPSREDTKSYL